MNTGPATGKRQSSATKSLISAVETDWAMLESLDWVSAMQQCPQEPEYHAEGDVWTHTRMVIAALQALPEYQAQHPEDQNLLLHAALLHDVAKPACTVVENGKISSPRHAKIGEKIAREILWDFDFSFRENVCALVRLHGLPIWGWKNDPVRSSILAGWRVRNELTYILAKADVLGRICDTQSELMYRLELYRELCLENDCFFQAREWHNAHSRFRYFWSDETYPTEIFDDTTHEIVMLCGIAGSGKDTAYQKHYAHLPVVSLDQIRQELKIKPDDKNGQGKSGATGLRTRQGVLPPQTVFCVEQHQPDRRNARQTDRHSAGV
ncbi:MAG: HD domain-containing protein [Lewinellaceae bacterium]|nr:HD domain-containing protein [Lewinellaceae bacterium]